MNKIFCLETEWDQTLHDLKKKSPVLPRLDFLENAIKVDYIKRPKNKPIEKIKIDADIINKILVVKKR